jgi:hypothetical protein
MISIPILKVGNQGQPNESKSSNGTIEVTSHDEDYSAGETFKENFLISQAMNAHFDKELILECFK